ncbi:MAG TPA: hypothetical protein DIT18_00195, partial [Pseudomonas sp.]|nr:hypothetical protein [Pseudomonas sp.]
MRSGFSFDAMTKLWEPVGASLLANGRAAAAKPDDSIYLDEHGLTGAVNGASLSVSCMVRDGFGTAMRPFASELAPT